MTLETISKIADRRVLTLPLASIAVPADRVGFFDARHADSLGADMMANGQTDPIHVKQNGNAAKLPWTLVAGLHRLRGAEGVGLLEIDAIRVAAPGASAAELLRLELSENLDHRQRRPIELAMMMVARSRLEEAIDHPDHVGETQHQRGARVRHAAAVTVTAASDANEIVAFAGPKPASATMADAGGATDTISFAPDWRERTAVAMGCSLSKLEKYQRLHRAIVVELPDEAWRREDPRARELPQLLNFHPLGESFKAMDRLAALNPDARYLAAKAILARPDATKLDQVLMEAGINHSTGKRSGSGDHENRILSHWARAPLREQRLIGVQLASTAPRTIAEAMIEAFRKRGLLS